jgi:GH24 family phage-related lysozyme (muramidase)
MPTNQTKIQTSRAASNRLMGAGAYGMSTQAGGPDPKRLPMPQGISLNTTTGFGQAQMIAGNTMMNLGNTIGKIGIAIKQQNEANEKGRIVADGKVIEQYVDELSEISDPGARQEFLGGTVLPKMADFLDSGSEKYKYLREATGKIIESKISAIDTAYRADEAVAGAFRNLHQSLNQLPFAEDVPAFKKSVAEANSVLINANNQPGLFSQNNLNNMQQSYDLEVRKNAERFAVPKIKAFFSKEPIEKLAEIQDTFINTDEYIDPNNKELSDLEDLFALTVPPGEQAKLIASAFDERVKNIDRENKNDDAQHKKWEESHGKEVNALSGEISEKFGDIRNASPGARLDLYNNERTRIIEAPDLSDNMKRSLLSELDLIYKSETSIASSGATENKIKVQNSFFLDKNSEGKFFSDYIMQSALEGGTAQEDALNEFAQHIHTKYGIPTAIAKTLIPGRTIKDEREKLKASQMREMLLLFEGKQTILGLDGLTNAQKGEGAKILSWYNDPHMSLSEWNKKYEDYTGKTDAPPPQPKDKKVVPVYEADGTIVPPEKITKGDISPGDLIIDDKKQKPQPTENKTLTGLNTHVVDDTKSLDKDDNFAANFLYNLAPGHNIALLTQMGSSAIQGEVVKSLNKLDIPYNQKIKAGKILYDYWMGLKREFEGAAIIEKTKKLTEPVHHGDPGTPVSQEGLAKIAAPTNKGGSTKMGYTEKELAEGAVEEELMKFRTYPNVFKTINDSFLNNISSSVTENLPEAASEIWKLFGNLISPNPAEGSDPANISADNPGDNRMIPTPNTADERQMGLFDPAYSSKSGGIDLPGLVGNVGGFNYTQVKEMGAGDAKKFIDDGLGPETGNAGKPYLIGSHAASGKEHGYILSEKKELAEIMEENKQKLDLSKALAQAYIHEKPKLSKKAAARKAATEIRKVHGKAQEISIGYGHTITQEEFNNNSIVGESGRSYQIYATDTEEMIKLTPEQLEDIYRSDYLIAENKVKKVVGKHWEDLPDEAKTGLVDITFNAGTMGPKSATKLQKFLEDRTQENYDAFIAEFKNRKDTKSDSKDWEKKSTRRGRELADIKTLKSLIKKGKK